MKLWLTPFTAEDAAYWQVNDLAAASKIRQLFNQRKNTAAESAHQFTCLALEYPHLMSVKITPEHRIVSERLGGGIIVHQCRYYY